MAEEKKPKIDLKARLGKTAVGGQTPPPPVAGGGIPAPVPAPSANNIAAPISSSAGKSGGGLPVPPGIPVGPPPAFAKAPAVSLDPSNPLAAAVAPARAPAPAAPSQPPRAQRIEVDEMAVQEARKGARKQGLIAGVVVAAVLGVVGYIAGGAQEASKGRSKSVADAKSLAGDVQKSRDQLKALADKVEAGRNSLLKERKFPDALAKELGGINIDFDGAKLGGVRFSGFPQETTSSLIEYITSVQTVNDRKSAIATLLTKLQKPISEQLAAGQKPPSVRYVVLLGGPKDPAGNPFAVLAPLTKPIEVTNPQQLQLPAEFTATNPITNANVTAPKYSAGNLDKPAGVYVVPKSMDAACPSETVGQMAQLGSQLSRLITDIRGEQAAPGGDVVTESKPGLLERADKLVTALNRVQ
jgi:hypothetical protein